MNKASYVQKVRIYSTKTEKAEEPMPVFFR